MKRFIVALFLVLFSGSAFASCPNLPYNLTNGTTADANQVMGNLNALLNCINGSTNPNVIRSYLSGLTLANDGTSPTTNIDTAAGVATSDDNTTSMGVAAAVVKDANAAWAVGSGATVGCLDTGGSLSASTWYHVFIIERADTGVVDELCSTSATTPALPANYTEKRRIGSFKTDGSSHILGFVQFGDEFLWKSPVQDAGNVSVPTSPTLYSLGGVPTGLQVYARVRVLYASGSSAGSYGFLIQSPDETSAIANAQAGNDTLFTTVASNYVGTDLIVRVNTSAQVRWSSTLSGTVSYLNTYGWIDRRGRDN